MRRRALILDGYHTAIDGKMTLSAFHVETPTVRTAFQEVPGMDGSIDYSDALTGRPQYQTRKLTATLESSFGSREDRARRFGELIRRCNGRRIRIVSPDAPDSYYIGRVQIAEDFNLPTYGQISITATCEPWRYSAVPMVSELSAAPYPENALHSATVRYLADQSTCTQATVDAAAAFPTFSIHRGDMRSVAVWSIALDPNTDYYISARIRDGRGSWGIADAPDAPSVSSGAFRTGDSGVVYLRLTLLGNTQLIVTPVFILPASMLKILPNGAAPAVASATFGNDSSSIALLIGPNVTVFVNKGTYEVDLPPGNCPVAAVSQVNSTQQVTLLWTRGDF